MNPRHVAKLTKGTRCRDAVPSGNYPRILRLSVAPLVLILSILSSCLKSDFHAQRNRHTTLPTQQSSYNDPYERESTRAAEAELENSFFLDLLVSPGAHRSRSAQNCLSIQFHEKSISFAEQLRLLETLDMCSVNLSGAFDCLPLNPSHAKQIEQGQHLLTEDLPIKVDLGNSLAAATSVKYLDISDNNDQLKDFAAIGRCQGLEALSLRNSGLSTRRLNLLGPRIGEEQCAPSSSQISLQEFAPSLPNLKHLDIREVNCILGMERLAALSPGLRSILLDYSHFPELQESLSTETGQSGLNDLEWICVAADKREFPSNPINLSMFRALKGLALSGSFDRPLVIDHGSIPQLSTLILSDADFTLQDIQLTLGNSTNKWERVAFVNCRVHDNLLLYLLDNDIELSFFGVVEHISDKEN